MSQWWKEPLRIVQTNLQVSDTPLINAERLADQLLEMKANALTFNVGGIYAWYPTEVPFHTVNPMLEPGRDVVGEVVKACRERGIRFIARYDFSKATDNVYQAHPEWFVRLEENKPQIVAVDRFGNWPQLVSTCLHGGYQNEEVAHRVLRESMERYHPDGIFITSMIYAPCQCESCRKIYRERYGTDIPADPCAYAPGFAEDMMDESVVRYDRLVKSIDPDAAFLHRVMLGDGRRDQKAIFKASRWWFPNTGEYDLFFDHPIDMVHGETHNGLNNGRKAIGPRWGAGATVKLCRCMPREAPPVDFVHTAPGLPWRHTAMPAAEHRFWACQVPANGGQIWHSLTGIPDSIIDREQLESVRWIDERIEKTEPLMHTAQSAADVAVLWNDRSIHGWLEGLTAARIPYDILLKRQLQAGTAIRYRWLIVPEGTDCPDWLTDQLEAHVKNGGGLVLEGRVENERLRALAGLTGMQQKSEWLGASYLRIEDEALRQAANVAPIVPQSGAVYYSSFDDQTKRLASLIPPFAPMEGAGAPPERAVLPTVVHPWPMIARRGNVVTFSLPFHDLLEKYAMPQHRQLLDALLDGPRLVRVNQFEGVQLSVFACEGGYVAHLVNGVGERPLASVTRLHGMELTVELPQDETFESAQWLFGNEPVAARQEGARVVLSLPVVDSWEAVWIRTRKN